MTGYGRQRRVGGGGLKDGGPGRLLVVGGGPAGVAAATAAARQGYGVVLAERNAHLGGQLSIAGRALAHRELWGRWLAWAEAELKETAVEVRLRTLVTKDECAVWDRIVVATGARPSGAPPTLPGRCAVLGAWTAILRPAPLSGSVVVIDKDGEWSALDAAEVLATHGHAVYLVTERAAPGHRLRAREQAAYLARLEALSVLVLPRHQLVVQGQERRLVLRDLSVGSDRPVADHVGAVVVAPGRIPNDALWSEISTHPCVTRVADAVEPGGLEDAIIEGTRALKPAYRPSPC
ncbi:FAD-dependent oxidoreductase [Streptomyces sp. NPDC048191]|uniref:FAD-dependent oxidoreductase n=1 Tax=Streptomyces sp. NPDC048191 TaxID=3155484 RepID=UPI0033CCB190